MTPMQNAGKKLSHACIIESQSARERESLALKTAQEFLCSSSGKRPCGACRDCRKVEGGIHPDLIYINRARDSEGKPRRELYVDQIRAVIADASILPNEAGRKVYLFPEADLMNENAQNAMLKLLEEPPAHAAFILCAANAGSFLPTILSRCERFSVNGEDETAESPLSADFIRTAAEGKREELIRFCTANENMNTQGARAFLDGTRALVSEMLCMRAPDLGLSRRGMAHLLGELEKAGEYLDANVGVKHIFGFLQTLDLNKLK